MNCKHCGGGFSCGCQRSTAKDGSTVHKTCLKDYNNKITNQQNLRAYTHGNSNVNGQQR